MTPDRLLTHFDRIADAPDAIPRLRRFILDLAVRGKLVEQDPNDEPASELLERIQAEKAQLLKVGAIRKEKPRPILTEDDLPFSIPKSWCWSQLSETGFLNPRNTAPDDLRASFVPMPLISAEYGVPNKHEVRPWSDMKSGYTHFAEGDVALAKITPCFENGKSTVFRGLTGGLGAGTTELHVVRPVIVIADYILLFLKCPHFIESGIPQMTGTAGQKRVPNEYFAYSPFPLPPLAEQHRIVAKVDELMALCDRLEAAQAERERRRDRLAAASLHRLNNGADGSDFREHARFHLDYLARFTTRPDQISALRQTILNLAVRGKLVPQDTNDEPASELLEQIEKRKQQLLETEEIKRTKACRQFDENEVPQNIPDSWAWTMLGEITDIGTGSTPSRTQISFWSDGTIPWVTSGSTSNSVITSGDEFITLEAVKAHRLRLYQPGTLLVALYGQGKTRGQVATLGIKATINQACAAVCPIKGFESLQAYLKILLLKNYDEVRLLSAGGAQPNLNVQKIKEIFVPLPPLAEQHRIVAKVEELLALCDQLEAQLANTQTESRRLLEAVLHEALAPAA